MRRFQTASYTWDEDFVVALVAISVLGDDAAIRWTPEGSLEVTCRTGATKLLLSLRGRISDCVWSYDADGRLIVRLTKVAASSFFFPAFFLHLLFEHTCITQRGCCI